MDRLVAKGVFLISQFLGKGVGEVVQVTGESSALFDRVPLFAYGLACGRKRRSEGAGTFECREVEEGGLSIYQ